MDYTLDKERQLVISVASGRLSFTEVRAHQDRLLADPNFKPEFNQLLDGRTITDLDMTVDEARLLARRPLFSDKTRRAWVSPSPAIYGMGRLMATHNEYSVAKSQVRVFYDLASAMEWLGLDNSAVRA